MTLKGTRTQFALLFLCVIATCVESISLTTEPSSVNVSLVEEAVFVCSAEENTEFDVLNIGWRNTSTQEEFSSNSSLGITISEFDDDSSNIITSVLRIEGRQEYNETIVECVAVALDGISTSMAESNDAILLIQGPLDAVHIRINDLLEIDDCCKLILWEEPFSLDGVPILGYNVTSTDLNHESFVTESMETIVCSNQLQHDNATVIIQAYNGVDGDVASVGLEFNIDVQPVINVGNEQLASNGQNWTLPITIVQLVCNGMSEDLDTLTVAIKDKGNGSVSQQTLAPFSGTKVNLVLPDNQKYLLHENFSLSFSNGLSLSSNISFNRTISTFDFRDVGVDYESENKTCLTCEAIANSQAEACLLHVNSTENETDQAFTITPDPTNIYRTCVDVVPGIYSLTAFDVSSEVGPLTATPAVVVTSVLLSPTIAFPPTSFTTISPSLMNATSTYLGLLVGIPVSLAFIVIIVILVIFVALIVKKYQQSKDIGNGEQKDKNDEQSAEAQLQTSVWIQPEVTKNQVENYTDIVSLPGAPMHLPLELNPVVYSAVQVQPAINPRVSYEQVMEFVAAKITEKWYEMGRALHLPTFILEDIEQNNNGDPASCISDVFLEWKKHRSRAYTWQAIIAALRSSDIGENSLAQDLESQLQVHVPCTQGGETTVYQQLNRGKQNSATITHATCTSEYGTLDTKGSNLEFAVVEAVKKLNPSIWHKLGLSLAITPPDLEMIRARNKDDPGRCLWEVVTTWKEKQTRPFHLDILNQILSSFGDYQMVTTPFSTKL